ncbi:hypothetical protein LCGC14_2998170, partial [marine sediment metagenome]
MFRDSRASTAGSYKSRFGRGRSTRVAGHLARRRLALEQLETRLVLQAGPFVINEFMALNGSGLLDEDNASSDWIEILNTYATEQSLDNWYLTDDAGDLSKWRLPAITLQPDDSRLVFASGKDRTDPAGELHANFNLSGNGEYLALVQPDGETIGHEFAPEYPQQVNNISYGLEREELPLASAANEQSYLIPT